MRHNKLPKQYLKYRIRGILPVAFWNLLARAVVNLRSTQFAENRSQSSADAGLDYFIIRRRPPGAGLFSNVNHVLQGLLRAEELGLEPVVDMQNYWTWYSQKGTFIGTRNAWEYFFMQLNQVDLSNIPKSAGITLSKGDRILGDHWLTSLGLEFATDKVKIQKLHDLWTQRIFLNSFCQRLLDETKLYLDWRPTISLGASFRGTEYSEVRPKGHAIQPSAKDFLTENIKILRALKYERLFLSSEDVELRKQFESVNSSYCYPDFRNSTWFGEKLRELTASPDLNSEIIRTYGYLIEVYLLAECDSLVASIANGSVGALILNGNQYRHTTIFNLGCY